MFISTAGISRRNSRRTVRPAGKACGCLCVNHRMNRHIGKPIDRADDCSKRRRNRRISHSGDPRLPIHFEAMEARRQRSCHRIGRRRRTHKHSARCALHRRKSLRTQPVRYCLHIMLRRPESLANLLRGQPAVIVRRAGVLLVRKQSFKARLHLRRARKNKSKAQRSIACNHSAIIRAHSPCWDVTPQPDGGSQVGTNRDAVFLSARILLGKDREGN